jgi:hypothetical protein
MCAGWTSTSELRPEEKRRWVSTGVPCCGGSRECRSERSSAHGAVVRAPQSGIKMCHQPRRSEEAATGAAVNGARSQKACCSQRLLQSDSLAVAILAEHRVRHTRGCRGADKHGHSRQDHGAEFTVVREPAPSGGALDPVHER